MNVPNHPIFKSKLINNEFLAKEIAVARSKNPFTSEENLESWILTGLRAVANEAEVQCACTKIDTKSNVSNETYMYREVCALVKSIFNASGFRVQTFNESVLVSYMSALGYPIEIDYSDRDIAKDYASHCEMRAEARSDLS